MTRMMGVFVNSNKDGSVGETVEPEIGARRCVKTIGLGGVNRLLQSAGF